MLVDSTVNRPRGFSFIVQGVSNKDEQATMEELERPKRALVLSGGGARGAYEIGVLRALQEKNITFDLAFGTSIGGINAAFFAQGKLDRLEKLWLNLTAADVFRLPNITQLRHLLSGNRWGLLDTSPLEEVLYREMDLAAFKKSKTKVGFLTTDLCTLETRLITTDDINTTEELVDTLMASSAIPIIFPARTLKGEGFWIDGGLVRNTPIQTAINMGAKEIYIVLVQSESDGVCPQNIMQVLSRCADLLLYASARDGIKLLNDYNRAIKSFHSDEVESRSLSIKVFQPSNGVNFTILDVNPARSKSIIEQGYLDAISLLSSD